MSTRTFFYCHLPSALQLHKTLWPFWQYGFEHSHGRQKRSFERSMRGGVSRTTGRNGLEVVLGADNLDLELWDLYGMERAPKTLGRAAATQMGLVDINRPRF